MKSSISFLLGAGFSAPQGYPIGNGLNQKILNCANDKIRFNTDGRLYIESSPRQPVNHFDGFFLDLQELIKIFQLRNKGFDYEEFYDFLIFDLKKEDTLLQKLKINDVGTALLNFKNTYSQLVSFYLKDRNGESWYDNAGHACGPTWQDYTGVLNCFQTIGEKFNVNIHTLNHDLFLERFNSSDWFQSQICDGFEELGSPYYGVLNKSGRRYNCRLQRYTGVYDKKYCLFKLHGELFSSIEPNINYEVYESEHAIQHEFWGGYTRHNRLNRKTLNKQTGEVLSDELVTENHAIMMYEPLLPK